MIGDETTERYSSSSDDEQVETLACAAKDGGMYLFICIYLFDNFNYSLSQWNLSTLLIQARGMIKCSMLHEHEIVFDLQKLKRKFRRIAMLANQKITTMVSVINLNKEHLI